MLYIFAVVLFQIANKVHCQIYSYHELTNELIDFIPDNLILNSDWTVAVKSRVLFGVFSFDNIKLIKNSKLKRVNSTKSYPLSPMRPTIPINEYILSNNTKRMLKHILSKEPTKYHGEIVSSPTFSDCDEDELIVMNELTNPLDLSGGSEWVKESKIISNESKHNTNVVGDEFKIKKENEKDTKNIDDEKDMNSVKNIVLDVSYKFDKKTYKNENALNNIKFRNNVFKTNLNNKNIIKEKNDNINSDVVMSPLMKKIIDKFNILKSSSAPKRYDPKYEYILENLIECKNIFDLGLKTLRIFFKVHMLDLAIYRISF